MLLWFAPNTGTAVLARVLQGFANTVVWTTGLAIMVDTAGEALVGEYMGYVRLALNAGTLVAPLLGGVVFARSGYNAVFAMSLGLIGVDILLRLVMIERHVAEQQSAVQDGDEESIASRSIDMNGTARASLSPLRRPRKSKTNTAKRRRCTWRLPEMLQLLLYPRFLSALWGVFIQALITSAFQAILPLAVNTFYHWKSVRAGLMFLPLTAPALLGPLIGKASDKTVPRYWAFMGFLLICPALVLLRFVAYDGAG